jgi:hypothetical protein
MVSGLLNSACGLGPSLVGLFRVGWRGCGVTVVRAGPAAPARDFCWQNYSINKGEFDRFCLLEGMAWVL